MQIWKQNNHHEKTNFTLTNYHCRNKSVRTNQHKGSAWGGKWKSSWKLKFFLKSAYVNDVIQGRKTWSLSCTGEDNNQKLAWHHLKRLDRKKVTHLRLFSLLQAVQKSVRGPCRKKREVEKHSFGQKDNDERDKISSP